MPSDFRGSDNSLSDADNLMADKIALTAEQVVHNAGVAIARHKHDSGQLSLVTKGTMALFDDTGWWLAPPGRGIWIPAGTAHEVSYAESSAHIKVLVSSEYADDLPKTCRTLPVSGLLKELALELSGVPKNAGHSRRAILMAELLVLEAAQPSADNVLFVPQGRDQRLVRVIERMHSHPGDDKTLEEHAKIASCSARTLARLYMAETGMTFTRWREHLRIVNAVDRLIRGDTITQAALDLGYQSPSSFTTMFTRILGVPPARYIRDTMARPSAAHLP